MQNLKQYEIIQLTRCINTEVEMTATNHDGAISRLHSVLESRIGRKLTEEELTRMSNCNEFMTAHHVIGDIIEPGSSPDQPKPQTERKRPMTATKTAPKTAPKKTPAKKPATKPAEKKPAASRGTINLVKGVTENPRREGTHGYRSMQIVMKAGAKGISYEDYIAKGGRAQDLRWDIDKGNVTLTPPKS